MGIIIFGSTFPIYQLVCYRLRVLIHKEGVRTRQMPLATNPFFMNQYQ